MDDDGSGAAAAAAFAALPQGCGHLQPKLRRIGLVLHLEYPEGKEEQARDRGVRLSRRAFFYPPPISRHRS